ncbi:hypothetical protein SAMN04487948_109112 [Halogranum amylolyticum]|uniref:Methyltransferase domain-containing protein n=1 Tax=Halogranum amylolyticum TaxID=660520 RepID=A0A1H8U3S1_9EURY|nr:hypothetical protein [Halogranum amylolyticum]SEO97717.1 hypothetical protein SAMN04487948_109112 [Halogranum amylolyticum]
MSRPEEFSFRRYLAAKRTVDDRALHRPTLDRLTETVAGRDPLAVIEVAAGVGTGLQRLLAWDRLPDRLDYTLLDRDATNVDAARKRLSSWASDVGYAVTRRDGTLELARGSESVVIRFETADALAYADQVDGRFDLLVGQAFLDLVDLADGLPALFDLVADGGLAYFPITFDGVTAFSPTPDPELERRVLDAYHATMDAPDRAGGSTTGRELLAAVPEAGGEVVAAGGSDWVVHPPYPVDEAYFLHHLVDTVAGAVDGDVDDADRRTWAADRHDAVASGELRFLAHNVDVLARVVR